MKEIKRDIYLEKLNDRRDSGLIKIITRMRRCDKSYLLDPIYKNYLLSIGIKDDHIIKIDLENREKTLQEERPLINIGDEFKKIIIVKDNIIPWHKEEGILVIGIEEFLFNPNSLDL